MKLSFKEMCAHFAVTPRTLRHYEYIELLTPERQGRTRIYGPKEMARMTLIMRGRRFGFALEEIRQWLELYEKHGEQAQIAAFLTMVDERIAAFEAEKERIDTVIAEMRTLADELSTRNKRTQSCEPKTQSLHSPSLSS